ncbi:hypothetical protein AB4Z09_17185 [Rhodococcus sp. TAF43]|uniref:hypothetical protein n=1 Tax=unclassified Rhodococcus (in: high G+C Gram-positive bacteria) TaxID=192944 RepID=UPI001582FDD7|nr:hypothetical protein [Rhodococcus sp. W8901]QKT09785.1 hypothetical protein HUN07_02730 [Rhodococcus sp. W8901]
MAQSDPGWPATVRYAFLVGGELSERVLAAFPELQVSETARAHTTLYGPVRSPTELRGMLARFDSLGLTVIEMRRLPD